MDCLYWTLFVCFDLSGFIMFPVFFKSNFVGLCLVAIVEVLCFSVL